MPNKSLSALTRRHAAAVLACFSFTAAIGSACTPTTLEQELRPFDKKFDSLIVRTARDSSPTWRADNFPAASLHGPFPRPKLYDGADTNDAVAYFTRGANLSRSRPGLADRYLYWAIRLDPTFADAYWARWRVRRIALYYRLYPDDTVRAVFRALPNEVAAIDSLRAAALMYDPFLDAALNIPPMVRVLTEMQSDRDPALSGLRAYSRGNYAKAVQKWAEAIKKKPENAGLHVPRAFAWLRLSGATDSAVADLTALINRLEQIQDSTVAPYLSKDFLYYAIGFLRGRQSHYAEARLAYEGALSENLGFYMAHVRLSAIDLELHDTTAAVTELETASLMRTDDPILLAFRGQILLGEGQLQAADSALRAAVHADTDFAMSYAFLGRLAELRHDTAQALGRYGEYLARASHGAPERGWVEDRVKHLAKPSGN